MFLSFMKLSSAVKVKTIIILYLLCSLIYLKLITPHPGFYIIPLFLTAIGLPTKKSWFFVPLVILTGLAKDLYFNLISIPQIFVEYLVITFIFSAVFYLGAELKKAYDNLHQAKEELHILYDREKELANIDFLTGLGNHRYFQQNLSREMELAQAKGTPLGVIMFDIDNFKRFNDTYGHQSGDMLINNIAAIIKHYAGEKDIACRYGGEEFIMIIPGVNRQKLRETADKIRKAVEDTRFMGGNQTEWIITISGGVALYPEDAQTTSQLVKIADERLYQVKRGGKNKVA